MGKMSLTKKGRSLHSNYNSFLNVKMLFYLGSVLDKKILV